MAPALCRLCFHQAENGENELARQLFERLLERTQHVKVRTVVPLNCCCTLYRCAANGELDMAGLQGLLGCCCYSVHISARGHKKPSYALPDAFCFVCCRSIWLWSFLIKPGVVPSSSLSRDRDAPPRNRLRCG